MKDVLNFIVVSMLLCIMQTLASDVLQCTGERHSDGQFYFQTSQNVKDVHDCETQWLVNGKLAAFYNGEEKQCSMPVVNITVNTATLQDCPAQLECLLICPSTKIHEKKPCLCETLPPGTLSEVGSSNGKNVWIGIVVVGLLAIVITISILVFKRKPRARYTSCICDV